MSDVEYQGKSYSFKWRSIGFFFLGCPLIIIIVYSLFEYFWVFTHPPFVFPISSLLNWITGQDFSFYPGANKYFISVPNKTNIGFNAACSGIYAYAIYLGICITTPHNKHQEQKKNVWYRKIKKFFMASLAVFCYNVFRVVLTILFYSNGVPFNPMHEYISYTLTFFAVFVFYFISYFWLPEFSLFVIWMKDDLKQRIEKLRAGEKTNEELSPVHGVKKFLLISTWIIICIVLFLIVSVLLV